MVPWTGGAAFATRSTPRSARRASIRVGGTFVRAYDTDALDASLLLLPIVGFVPPDDPRVIATVDAVQGDLCTDGLVRRYRTPDPSADGLPPGEGAFLACSFWLVDALALIGRIQEARTLFERLLALRNDVGLLSEEYGIESRRFLGNFPQALSHTSLIRSAMTFSGYGAELTGRPDSGPSPNRGGLGG